MNPKMSLEDLVAEGVRRADRDERVHPGFGFASMAPSPLKVREQAREEAQAEPLVEASPEPGGDLGLADVTARLEAARVRLREAAAAAHRVTES